MHDETQDQMIALLRVIRENQQACRRYMPDLNGIPHGEFHMLQAIEAMFEESRHLYPPPVGVKISLLSTHSQISRPAVSQTIKSLEKKQLVERIASEHDRRVVYVRPTEQGRQVIHESQEFFYQFLGKVIEQLGQQDTQTLICLLRKMNQIILSLDWRAVRKECDGASVQDPRKGDPSL